jgi:Tfp pilus assembly protein PilN
MKAVNLIPNESRRGGVGFSVGRLGVSHLVLGLLAIGLAFVTVYVITSNSVSQRKAHLASLQQQVSRVQTEVARLNTYAQFEKLAQARAATVRQIASTRFDWHGALSDLSRVVPANTSLQSLSATVSTGASTGGASASSGGNVRNDINAPAFEMKGCTHTQDDVARLMSRLRLINGVTRVTLEDSVKQASGQPGAPVSSAGSSAGGCPARGPSFDVVVFFGPQAAATGPGAAGQTVSTGVTK